MRWIQGVLFQTLGKPSSEIYYAAIHPNDRRRVKPMIDTLAERWSDAVVGVLLIVALHVLHVPLKTIAIGTAVIAAVWLFVLMRLNRYYGRAFKQVLSSRWLEAEEAPEAFRIPAARKALVEALGGDDERGIVLALELCERVRDPKIARAIVGCLRHPAAIVVTTAIGTMESMRLADPEGVIEGFLSGSNEDVRRAAVRYQLAVVREPIAFARRLLDGADPALRQYVVEALVDHPHRASGAMTTEWVDARIRSGKPEDLLLAARALGAMAGPPERMRTMLANPDVEVRRAALISAARRPNPELLDVMIEALFVPELAFEARRAVAALGDSAVPALQRLLDGDRGEGAQALAARALAHIASPRAVEVLLTLVRGDDLQLRQLGLEGLARARVRIGRPILPRAIVHRLFLRELNEYRACREPGLAHEDNMEPEVRLLAESYLESAEMALERAVTALACWYDPKPLAGVFERLKSPDRAGGGAGVGILGAGAAPTSVPTGEPDFRGDEDRPSRRSRRSPQGGAPHRGRVGLGRCLAARLRRPGGAACTGLRSSPIRRRGPRPSLGLRRTRIAGCQRGRDDRVTPTRPGAGGGRVLTAVERVLILKGADLLNDIGPRHLLRLAEVARELELWKGNTIYKEDDLADGLYMVVEGRVRLTTGEQVTSEVGPGEAFGTWALVDDTERGHRVECIEDGLALMLPRDESHDVAAGDLTLLRGSFEHSPSACAPWCPSGRRRRDSRAKESRNPKRSTRRRRARSHSRSPPHRQPRWHRLPRLGRR